MPLADSQAHRAAQNRYRWWMRAAWLMLAILTLSYCGWRFSGPSPLQTNLLALLPKTEVDPVADKAVDTLAGVLDDRAVFLLVDNDDAIAKSAARQFGAALSASRAFRAVTAEVPPFDVSQIARFYLPYRFGLLSSDDRAMLASGSGALHDALARRLFSPVQTGLSTSLSDDPFGWLAHWLGGLPLASSNLTIEDGLLVTHRGTQTRVLVIASLAGSAYAAGTQQSVHMAVAQAEALVKQRFPSAHVVRTGAVFYAETARASSEHEVHRIGLVSLVGIALLMLWVFRSPWLLLLGFVSTAFGIVCALDATMLLFGKLHLLTLVFGASLIGEAVDYSIQYFIVYLGGDGRREWEPRRAARIVRPALMVALCTSLLGYAILGWMPFPALRQIACFAFVGISAAFASVLCLLPVMLVRAPKRSPRRLFETAGRLLEHWRHAIGGRRTWGIVVLLLLLAAPGWWRVSGNDDVHLLIHRDASLVAQENDIREAMGMDGGSQFFVVRGTSPERVLERETALTTKLAAMPAAEGLRAWSAVTSFVPSQKQQSDDHALLEKMVFHDPRALRAILLQAGFRDEAADVWLHAYSLSSSSSSLTLNAWLATPWSQPFHYLWLGKVQDSPVLYASVVVPQGITPRNEARLIDLATHTPGVRFVDKAASVSHVFSVYRAQSGWWFAAVSLLVLSLLMWRYGVKGGIAVMLPVWCAAGATLAVFGYADMPLTLFNWLALMLVLGVGANYAVFLREGCLRDDADLGATWVGVLLSAATTLLSFGLLALSDMPALKSFGLTLSIGIALAVLLAPIGMPTTAMPSAKRSDA